MTLRTPALVCDAATDSPLEATDLSELPSDVLADAQAVAAREYPRDEAKAADMASQVAAMYKAAMDVEILIIFSPGGWGWATVAGMPLWASILNGMEKTLSGLGQSVRVLNYQRTHHGLAGAVTECQAAVSKSQSKGHELAQRVEFLTCRLPRLKVILAGESNGAAMAEDAMGFLRNNMRVFSVQTGTPFWAPSKPFVRSLIINNNGVEPDTFSNGNVRRWFTANVRALFGKYKTSQGNILLYIGAPGHVYNWDYPAVKEQIVKFLKEKVVV